MIETFEKNSFLWLFWCVVVFFIFSTTTAYAQSIGEIGLSSSPTYPEPHEEVRVSLTQYGINTFGATINWYLNEVEQKEYRNERNMKFVTGEVGERSNVSVLISQDGGLALSSSRIFMPVLVDLVLESDTYVPYFYKGRALPSSESDLRAIAIVHDNTSTSDSKYTYKWFLESSTLFGGPVKGKSVAELTVPRFGNKKLSVEVSDSGGNVLGENSVVILAKDLDLHFYEENPLLGLSGKTVGNTLNLLGGETTIFGEPYYMRTTPEDSDVDFEWEINGRDAGSNAAENNAITLRRTGNTGSAQISLGVFVRKNVPQFVEGVFSLLFN